MLPLSLFHFDTKLSEQLRSNTSFKLLLMKIKLHMLRTSLFKTGTHDVLPLWNDLV